MKRVFFLNFACEEGKITGSRLVLRLPSNSLRYRDVVFCNNSVSFRDSCQGVYRRIKGQDRSTMKARRIAARITGRTFSKIG